MEQNITRFFEKLNNLVIYKFEKLKKSEEKSINKLKEKLTTDEKKIESKPLNVDAFLATLAFAAIVLILVF